MPGQTIDYKDAKIGWGNFVQSIIVFMIVGFCLFLVVKGMNRLKEIQGLEPPPTPAEQTPTEKLLSEIRDLLKTQAADKPEAEKPPG